MKPQTHLIAMVAEAFRLAYEASAAADSATNRAKPNTDDARFASYARDYARDCFDHAYQVATHVALTSNAKADVERQFQEMNATRHLDNAHAEHERCLEQAARVPSTRKLIHETYTTMKDGNSIEYGYTFKFEESDDVEFDLVLGGGPADDETKLLVETRFNRFAWAADAICAAYNSRGE